MNDPEFDLLNLLSSQASNTFLSNEAEDERRRIRERFRKLSIRDRYRHDPLFHHVVEQMRTLITRDEMSFDELLSALTCANLVIAERKMIEEIRSPLEGEYPSL